VKSLFGIAPGGACHASPVARPAVGSYPTVSPLPCMHGGLFSVALSLGLPRPGVTRHRYFMEPGLSSHSDLHPCTRPSDHPHMPHIGNVALRCNCYNRAAMQMVRALPLVGCAALF